MSDAPVKTPRRKLDFATSADVTREIKRLRRLQLRKKGNWTLPQACRHLSVVIENNLTPPPSDVPTPEEKAKKDGFFAVVFAPDGMPEQMPQGPATTPPADCTDAEIDRLLTAFNTLDAYPHACMKIGGCGPVPKTEVVRLHLAHAGHHLSFLEPEIQPRTGLQYQDEAAAIADVESLRQGYVQLGNWTLPQMCWHLGTILKFWMQPPQGPTQPPTPQQAAMLQQVLSEKKIGKIDAPPQILPPENADDPAIDLYLQMMARIATYDGPWMPHRLFGALTTEQYRKVNLIHTAHHFVNLVPTNN